MSTIRLGDTVISRDMVPYQVQGVANAIPERIRGRRMDNRRGYRTFHEEDLEGVDTGLWQEVERR